MLYIKTYGALMRKLKTTVADMVAAARDRIEEVETAEALALINDPGVVFVDLRDVRERQRSGYLPGSFHCPRGMAEFWVDPERSLLQGDLCRGKAFRLSLRVGLAFGSDRGDAARHGFSGSAFERRILRLAGRWRTHRAATERAQIASKRACVVVNSEIERRLKGCNVWRRIVAPCQLHQG